MKRQPDGKLHLRRPGGAMLVVVDNDANDLALEMLHAA